MIPTDQGALERLRRAWLDEDRETVQHVLLRRFGCHEADVPELREMFGPRPPRVATTDTSHYHRRRIRREKYRKQQGGTP